MELEIIGYIALILCVVIMILEFIIILKIKPKNTLSKYDLDEIKDLINNITKDKLDNQNLLLKESNNLLFRSLEIKFDMVMQN